MNEVNELLRQAWQKAYEEGVVLRDVSFSVSMELCGKRRLMSVNFDASLEKKTND